MSYLCKYNYYILYNYIQHRLFMSAISVLQKFHLCLLSFACAKFGCTIFSTDILFCVFLIGLLSPSVGC